MTNLRDITKAVEQLSPEELRAFANWFEELQERIWDEQIERDANAGKLDRLVEDALAADKAGKSRKLP